MIRILNIRVINNKLQDLTYTSLLSTLSSKVRIKEKEKKKGILT